MNYLLFPIVIAGIGYAAWTFWQVAPLFVWAVMGIAK